MANIEIRDGDGSEKHLKATGAGTSGDPFIPEHLETNSGAIKTAVESLDDAIVTEDTPSAGGEKALAVAGVRRDGDTSPVSADGDWHNFLFTALGFLKVSVKEIVNVTLAAGTNVIGKLAANDGVDIGDTTINNAGGASAVNIQDGGNSITVDGTVAATQSGVWTEANSAAIKTAVELIDDTVGTDGSATPTKGIMIAGQDGTNAQILKTDSNGELQVDILTLPALPAGSNNIGDVDVLSMPTGASAAQVQGTVAHDAAAAQNPVLIAGRANANEPTAVANGDASHIWLDPFGRQVVLSGHPSPETPKTVNLTASGTTEIIAAPGAGLSIYLNHASVHNSGATNITFDLREAVGGAAKWKAELAAEGGGSVIPFGSTGWKLAENTALVGNLSGAGDVNLNITEYYIAQ